LSITANSPGEVTDGFVFHDRLRRIGITPGSMRKIIAPHRDPQ